jgi:hypothetical protein
MNSADPDLNSPYPNFADPIYLFVYGGLPAPGRVVATLLACLLLLWPICSFTGMFVFNPPFRSQLDELRRHLLFFSVLLYPVLYGIGLGLARRAAKRTNATWKILLPFAIPAYAPALKLLSFMLQG